jgi:hypothetical protein
MMTALRESRRVRRAKRSETDALRRDLATYESPAELLELAAMLGRHDDADTEAIRNLVDLTRAA